MKFKLKDGDFFQSDIGEQYLAATPKTGDAAVKQEYVAEDVVFHRRSEHTINEA